MKVRVVTGDALSYTASDWLKYGDISEPTTREKMIMLGIEQIIRVGPADFASTQVCDRLDIKHPMVNHYFGSRAQFLAEVQWWAYREWGKYVDRTFRTAPANPRKRLKAFIEAELEWAKRMGGMNILIQYPMVSAETLELLTEQHNAEMTKMFEYHLALITVCVRDIRKGTLTPLDFDAETIPKDNLLKNASYFLAATQVSWATHGLAMWSSGKHIATQQLDQQKSAKNLSTDIAVKQMIKRIMQIAEK